MYIYNVTINIDDSIKDEWVEWMTSSHIPEVLQTGMFKGATFSRVMIDEESGTTYSVQYKVADLESMQIYQEMYAPALQEEHTRKFGNAATAFRTALDVIAEFTAERID